MEIVKSKFGFWSIMLLGVNAIVGSGIFLLPNKAYAQVGVYSLYVIIFDAFLVLCMALCFAEASGMFKKNGAAYVYAKEAFGEFVGFEVGFMKWAISIIAWAAMAAAFTKALSVVWEPAAEPMIRTIIQVVLIGGLGIMNIVGVKISALFNNIVTIAKLIPLILFVVIGIFFLDKANFAAPVVDAASSVINTTGTLTAATFASSVLLMFYAFTGFEAIATAAEDMENPQKNLPKVIVSVIIAVVIFYILILAVSIGTLGSSLATSNAPIADAMKTFLGVWGRDLVLAGTIVSIGGITLASSFLTPRAGVALAENGILPKFIGRNGRFGTPTAAIAISTILSILLSLSGTFYFLAAISVISRFVQYLPTCVAVVVLRRTRPDLKPSFRVPFGPVIPAIAVIISFWLLYNSSMYKILFGLGGLVVGAVLYFVMQYINKKEANKATKA